MNFKLLKANLDFLHRFNSNELSTLQSKFNLYERLFQSFVKVHNISHFKELEKEIIDSLKIVDFKDLSQKTIADIGSGAGFPALFLALVTKAQFYLFEPNLKKSAFLMLAKSELGLDNVVIINEKIELYQDKFIANIITSRALMNAKALANLCLGFFDENTLFLLYKGSGVFEELNGVKNYEIIEFQKRKYTLISGKEFLI